MNKTTDLDKIYHGKMVKLVADNNNKFFTIVQKPFLYSYTYTSTNIKWYLL